MLEPAHWKDFLSAGTRFGFAPRVADPFIFAQKRGVLFRHEPSGVGVDLIVGALSFEKEVVARAKWVVVSGVRLLLPTPEDLIVMKAIAGRARDVADIEAILDAHPKLDLRRVRRWSREFSTAMENPEILRDLEALLVRCRKRKRVDVRKRRGVRFPA